MKIIVCVKQVPDTSGKVAVKEDGTMDRAAMATISNPDDMNALEAALQIKDQNPDVKVIVLSMGPAPTESMLRECLAMGADEAVLISAREFGGADTYATSSTITAAIRKIGVEEGDIVFCGRQAIDGDTAQVGPQIAEKLDIPQVTYVTAIDYQNGQLTVRRELEDGGQGAGPSGGHGAFPHDDGVGVYRFALPVGGDGYSTTNMGHYEITVLVLFAQFRCSPDGGLLLVEHVHVAGAVDIVKTGDPGHILEFIRVWGIEQQGGAAEFFRKGLRQLAA